MSLFFTINRKPSIESISRIGIKYTSRRSVLMTLLAWKQKWWDFKYKGSKSFFAKFWESKTSIDTLLRWWPHSQKECSKISLISYSVHVPLPPGGTTYLQCMKNTILKRRNKLRKKIQFKRYSSTTSLFPMLDLIAATLLNWIVEICHVSQNLRWI